MDDKLNTGHNPSGNKRIDLSELLELSGGDEVLVAKYVGIFLNTVTKELNHIKSALENGNGQQLYSALHILKPQIELMGMKGILPELKMTEATLRENKDMTDAVMISAGFIFTEITLACHELESIQKNHIR